MPDQLRLLPDGVPSGHEGRHRPGDAYPFGVGVPWTLPTLREERL